MMVDNKHVYNNKITKQSDKFIYRPLSCRL